MEVEVIIEPKYSKPKVIIYTNNISKEVSDLLNQFQNFSLSTLNGYLENKVCLLNIEDIFIIYSENGKVYAKTTDAVYTLKYRLYEIEKQLDKNFIRISNSEIINLKKVKNLDLSILGTIKINFLNDSYAYSSRRFIKKIKEYLNL